MKKLIFSLFSFATLGLPAYAVPPETNPESRLQYQSLAYHCSFRPQEAAGLERSTFFARYLNREKPVPLEAFSDWFLTTYPETGNLQCFPYKTTLTTLSPEQQNATVQQDGNPAVQSVIEYVFGDFPGGYTGERTNLKGHAYGRQHHDRDGNVIVIGFTGEPVASDGITDKRPISWVVSFVSWGVGLAVRPCLYCIEKFLPGLWDKLLGAWQGWQKGSSGME